MTDRSLGAPVVLGANTLPVISQNFQPGITEGPVRDSGLPFAQGRTTPSKQPVFEFTTYYASARAALSSFRLVEFTTLEWYERDVTASGAASTTGNKNELAVGCRAMAHIASVQEGPNGTIVATISCRIISSGAHDGISPVIVKTAAQTVPTLSAEPTLHVRGPIEIGGSAVPGVTSFSFDTGNRIIAVEPTDGMTYARAVIDDGGERQFSIGTEGVKGTVAAIGLEGLDIGSGSALVIKLREIDINGNAKASGVSFTVADGRASVQTNGETGQQSRATIMVMPVNPGRNFDDSVAVGTW